MRSVVYMGVKLISLNQLINQRRGIVLYLIPTLLYEDACQYGGAAAVNWGVIRLISPSPLVIDARW